MTDGMDDRYEERYVDAAGGLHLWAMSDGLADVPTMLLRGLLSDILTESIIAKLRQRKADLQVVTVGNRGHAPLLDEQEATSAIKTFPEPV
jgi:pimeloyl-ACP methyl ester carboxylesterase